MLQQPPRGYLHIKAYRNVPLQWVTFSHEIPILWNPVGPVFLKLSLNKDLFACFLLFFQNFQTKFWVFGAVCHANTWNFWKAGLFWKKKKIPKNGYIFLPQWPLKMGMGFEVWAANPIYTKSEYPPPGWQPTRVTVIAQLWQGELKTRIILYC